MRTYSKEDRIKKKKKKIGEMKNKDAINKKSIKKENEMNKQNKESGLEE